MKILPLKPQSNETPKLLRIWVWVRIWIHVLYGILILSSIFPFVDHKKRAHHIQAWSKHLLEIFNVEIDVRGVSLLESNPHLIASNHISWLDIHVINAFKPIRFVAKSEVGSWPIFGWMAKQLGTVFIRRDSARHARLVSSQMAEVLKTESICIFPEGTSSNGETVLQFKPNLFESAIVSQVLAYPVSIRYLSKNTRARNDAPAFIGDMSLLGSMSNIINNRNLVAQITILPPCGNALKAGVDRKQLAAYCQEAIAKTL